MTSVAANFATKLAQKASEAIGVMILSLINYQQGGGVQTDQTKFYIFSLATVVPVVTGILGYIPMFFYNLTGDKRDKMYDELMQRRSEAARKATAETENAKG